LKVTGCRTATAVMGAVLVTFGMVVTSLVLNPVKRRSDRSKRMHSRLSLVLSFSTLTCLLHRPYRAILFLLHESAGTGPLESIPRTMVALANGHGYLSRRHRQCEMGGAFYHRLGGDSHHSSVVGSSG
jgi:hypothetical protein